MGDFRDRQTSTPHVPIDAQWIAVRTRIGAEFYRVSYDSSVQRGEKLMNIRRLGLSILRAAVRRAAPGLQEWGDAMLNEVDAIEGEWTAFRWALGSAAVLYRGCEVPINDACEIPRRLEHLQETTRRRQRAGYLVSLFVIGGFVHNFTVSPTIPERIGCVLTILAGGILTLQLYVNARRRRAAAPANASSTVADRYKAVLQHVRDFHRGTWFWSRLIALLPGPILFMYEFHRAHPEQIFLPVLIAFLVFGILAVPLNLNLSRKFQREIDRLDDLRKQP